MFTILLSTIFTTCILAAPAPPQNKPTPLQWSKFKQEKSLARFHNTLLNETFLPFLDECYTDQIGQTNRESKTTESLCSRYFDAVLQLNNTDFSVNVTSVEKLLGQWDPSESFCDQKHIFPDNKHILNVSNRNFNNPAVCGISCLNDDATTPKPICRFLAWMGEEIKINSAKVSKVEIVKEAPVVSTAAVSLQNVVNVSPKVSETSKKTVDSLHVQEKIKEIIKADATAEKPAHNSSKIETVPNPTPSTITASSVEKLVKPEVHEPQPKEAAAAPIPTSQKEVKKPELPVLPVEEDKDNVEPATINSGAFDPNQPVELPKTKEDIPDYEPPKLKQEKSDYVETPDTEEDSNGDDTVIGDEFSQPNDKTSNIINPENEHNHSSSQEIIDSNVVPATSSNIQKDPFHEQSGSNFFTYFLIAMFLCIAMYVVYHNKSKLLALLLEGRRGDKGRGGRRKHTAAYRKLDSNLEEAITSSARGRTTQIIY